MGAVLAIVVVGIALYAIVAAVSLAAHEDGERQLRQPQNDDQGSTGDETHSTSDRAGCAHQAFRLSASSQSGAVPTCIDNGEFGQPAR